MHEGKIIELAPYSLEFKIVGQMVLVSLVYPDNWQIVPPANENVKCREIKGRFYYKSQIDQTLIDEIFQSIDDTIGYNQDMAAKLEVLNEKVNEMYEIFKHEDLETLKGLKFVYGKKKSKKNKKENEVVTVKPDLDDRITSETASPVKEDNIQAADVESEPKTEILDEPTEDAVTVIQEYRGSDDGLVSEEETVMSYDDLISEI